MDWFYEFQTKKQDLIMNSIQIKHSDLKWPGPDLCKPKSIEVSKVFWHQTQQRSVSPVEVAETSCILHPIHIMRILIRAPFLAMAKRNSFGSRHIRLADEKPMLQPFLKWLELFWRTMAWYDVPLYGPGFWSWHMYYKYLHICSLECCGCSSNNS